MVEAYNAPGYSVTLLGATGNGSQDDTKAIQNALNSYNDVYIPDGIYLINAVESLKLQSNQTLTLSDAAELRALPNASPVSSVLLIENASNVTVAGGRIVGERDTHQGSSGEWGMGITVGSAASSVLISNMTITGCWGDGIYLGGETKPANITIDTVVSENNRRQGLSITNAEDVLIHNCVFKDTNGTAPAAGIDIEPNAGENTGRITITRTQCFNNAGTGLQIMGLYTKVEHVKVSDCEFTDNSSHGIEIDNAANLTFENVVTANNSYGLFVDRDTTGAAFLNLKACNNKYRGVSITTSGQESGTSDIIFESSEFYNNSQARSGNADGVRIDNFDQTGHVNNITFNNCRFFDDQKTKTQRYGLTVGFSGKMNNILLKKNCIFSGNLNGNSLGGPALIIAGG